jgi:hypothetical protein
VKPHPIDLYRSTQGSVTVYDPAKPGYSRDWLMTIPGMETCGSGSDIGVRGNDSMMVGIS